VAAPHLAALAALGARERESTLLLPPRGLGRRCHQRPYASPRRSRRWGGRLRAQLSSMLMPAIDSMRMPVEDKGQGMER